MKKRIEIGLLAVAVMLLTGCRQVDEDTETNDAPVNVRMAYTFNPDIAGSQTRLADSVTISNQYPQDLKIIALRNDNPMTSLISWNNVFRDDDKGFYRFEDCQLATGVNRCLVYGEVAAQTPAVGLTTKVYNGSLEGIIPTTLSSVRDVRNISFNLESIYDGTSAPDGADSLAQALTTVANLDDWKNSDNAILKNLRQNFINNGFNLPGSAAAVKQWLLSLASSAKSMIDAPNSTLSDSEKTILTAIQSAAKDKADTITVLYPRNLYLPDGAAVLQWDDADGGKFVPQIQATTFDNVTAMWRYAYPASLYYFCDTGIKTSTSVSLSSLYTSKNNWSSVLDEFDGGDAVTTTTKAVALENPVRYAVARLKVKMKASSAPLKDGGNEDVVIDDISLTGIIVGGQRPVDYLFRQTSSSEDDMKFIYDTQVKQENSKLTPSLAEVCTTLVLQSYDGEGVNIILEFENKSDSKFKGLDGFVYPNTRFYLVGKIPATGGSGGDATYLGRVFTKGYDTVVNIGIQSLANAYSVLPNMLSSNLEIGLQIIPEWIAATPTSIRLE